MLNRRWFFGSLLGFAFFGKERPVRAQSGFAPMLRDLTLVGFGQSYGIERRYGPEGEVTEVLPVPGSVSTHLNLELPNGKVIQARIKTEDFHNEVVPLLKVQLLPVTPQETQEAKQEGVLFAWTNK